MRDARSRLFVPETVGSTPGFNPADFGASYSWFAARLEVGYVDGQEVLSLADFGTAALPMNATGATQRPVYKVGSDPNAPNSQPLLRYTLDGMIGTHGLVNPPSTIAIVYRSLSAGTIVGNATVGASATGLRPTSATAMAMYKGTSFGISNVNGYDGSGWQVCLFSTSETDPDRLVVTLFKSGMTQGASPNNYYSFTTGDSANGTFPANTFRIGAPNWTGDIAEVVWWRSNIALADRIIAGKQLSDLYGVTY
jgi:hypothetical protein